jgi:8-oxo-dGTP pyrophosphatase MutT (NUDIX family)
MRDSLRRRLAEPLPGVSAQLRMAPQPRTPLDPLLSLDDLRPAAALLVLYQHEGAWRFPLTLRGATLRHHTGQVSLPGGRIDPGESAEQAALREAFEEIGMAPDAVEILGRLTPLPIPISSHQLQPIVGYIPMRPQFVLAEHEVDRVIEASIAELMDERSVGRDIRERSRQPFGPMEVPYFMVDTEQVWGATAMVLAEFLAVWGQVLNP